MSADNEAIDAFAEVFTDAGRQLDAIRTSLMPTEVVPADFGNSWHGVGEEFIEHTQRIGADLEHLVRLLEGAGAALQQSVETLGGTEEPVDGSPFAESEPTDRALIAKPQPVESSPFAESEPTERALIVRDASPAIQDRIPADPEPSPTTVDYADIT